MTNLKANYIFTLFEWNKICTVLLTNCLKIISRKYFLKRNTRLNSSTIRREVKPAKDIECADEIVVNLWCVWYSLSCMTAAAIMRRFASEREKYAFVYRPIRFTRSRSPHHPCLFMLPWLCIGTNSRTPHHTRYHISWIEDQISCFIY